MVEPASTPPPGPQRLLTSDPPPGMFTATLLVLLSGSAVYFSGSIAAPALQARWAVSALAASTLTMSVQLGFVAGTLLAVALDLADRVAPRRLLPALLVGAAAANLLVVVAPNVWVGAGLRLLTGMLSGPVYPIGMRLLATWYPRLGARLGILLGAYTFGVGATAVLRAASVPWEAAVAGASVLALGGAGLAGRLLHNGPLLPSRQRLDAGATARAYRVPDFRRSSLGYFGHMWELFAFWALVPFWVQATGSRGLQADVLVASVFVAGGFGCLAAAWASTKTSAARVARFALAASGLACILSPWLFIAPTWVTAIGLSLWGAAVVADSPMFSALSAEAAPRGDVGAALTIQNGIGFAIPIAPILIIPAIIDVAGGWRYAFLVLAVGPLFGLPFVHRLARAAGREGTLR